MLPDVRYALRLQTGRCCVKFVHLTVKQLERTRNANPIYRNFRPHRNNIEQEHLYIVLLKRT